MSSTRQVDELPLIIELLRWMLKLFGSGGSCDLWPSSFAAFHGCNMQSFLPSGNPGCWNAIGWTGNQNKNRHFDMEHTFRSRITGCSIAFFKELACFLNICKHIMALYALVQSKITYSTLFWLFNCNDCHTVLCVTCFLLSHCASEIPSMKDHPWLKCVLIIDHACCVCVRAQDLCLSADDKVPEEGVILPSSLLTRSMCQLM